MRKMLCLLPVLLLTVFLMAACGQPSAETIAPTGSQIVDNIFTEPETQTETTTIQSAPKGAYFRIANEAETDETGAYLVYAGGDMHLLLRMCVGELQEQNFGIHLYVDGQPQPYHTADDETIRYMHVFSSMNGKEFSLDLIFTPVTGQAGDVLEVGLALVAYPEYFIDDAWDGITMMDWSGMGMTVCMKYLDDPPSAYLPEVPDRVVNMSQAYIDLTASETALFASGEYQKEVEYDICVNGQKSYGNLFAVTGEDTLEVEFELKGSAAADFGLVMYLDHQPVSVSEDDLTFIRARNGKKVTLKAEIDLSGFDGEGVFYAVLVPRNYRINQLGGSCLLTILGPYYLSDMQNICE